MSMLKIILGTLTFSNQADAATSLRMLELFQGKNGHELDTAHQYNDGKTEALLGRLLTENPGLKFKMATKVNPWNDDGLKPEQVATQLTESLERLRAAAVDLLYLHSPDLDTPIADTLAKCWEFYQQGAFRRFGLSNFSAWQVAEVVETCRARGWMTPTVYQGMYNALTRDVERELLPCLRNYGIRFYAYNPLAGGLLTGKHTNFEQAPEYGRFLSNNQYTTRYWKADYFDVLATLTAACAKHGVTPANAALRWLVHHSQLSAKDGDGIILGASKLSQLQQNLAHVDGGKLADDIVAILDRGWQRIKPDCAKYFRP